MSRILTAALLLAAGAASAADAAKSPARACVKWSKDIPDAIAAGEKLFASFTRVEGPGPYYGCDVVGEVEDFGVGWLMRAYMKEAVLSPCGKKLGRFSFHYKGDAWQEKLAAGLHEWVVKHPEAFAAAEKCPAPPPAAAAPVPAAPASSPVPAVEASTAAATAPAVQVSTPAAAIPAEGPKP